MTAPPGRPPSAVLFDLDDTLFDHSYCASAALEAVRSSHSCFASVMPEELARRHAEILEELHLHVIAGRIELDAARRERFRRLFATAGVRADEDLVVRAASGYREHYLESWREVPGAGALLGALRGRARLGIVSNNLLREQQDKLRFCGFDVQVDAVVISEEAGVSKPDPAIFRMALAALGCRPEEAVMIGDAWRTDVAGALAAGIRPIWFNRAGVPSPDPAARVAEIRALEPVSHVIDTVFRPEPTADTGRP